RQPRQERPEGVSGSERPVDHEHRIALAAHLEVDAGAVYRYVAGRSCRGHLAPKGLRKALTTFASTLPSLTSSYDPAAAGTTNVSAKLNLRSPPSAVRSKTGPPSTTFRTCGDPSVVMRAAVVTSMRWTS